MSESARIRKFYIEPPFHMVEIEANKRQGRERVHSCVFEITTKIWVDKHLPEYRVVIPELGKCREVMLEHLSDYLPIETRTITYVPTGRVIYDNSKPHAEAVVYEYILETLLHKKELRIK